MDVSVAAVITAHDRQTFLPEAIRSAVAAGVDEVVVVRNFTGPLEIPSALRSQDLQVTESETGAKQTVGLAACRSDAVCFLDDDDLWDPRKGLAVRDWFAMNPAIQYAVHFQIPVDAVNRPVVARHAEWARRTFEAPSGDLWNGFRTFHDRHWPGNNSSTCVRRVWALGVAPWLARAGWSADTFWFVAAVLAGRDGSRIWVAPDRFTRLRLHDANMSQTRGSDRMKFRERHRIMCERFGRASGIMTEMVRSYGAGGTELERFLVEREQIFRYCADLESGRLSRRSALKAVWRGPRGDRSYTLATLLSVGSPELARRAIYRSSLKRWATG